MIAWRPIAKLVHTSTTNDTTGRGQLRLVVVGGPDLHLRTALLSLLQQHFELTALGSGAPPSAGIPYRRYRLGSGVTPLADLTTVVALTRHFGNLRPDIVHAYDTKPSVLARTAARRAGVPVALATLPGLGSLYARSDFNTVAVRWVYERLQRRACHGSALTLVQNPDDLDELGRRGIAAPERLALVPGSGVDLNRFRPAAQDPARRQAGRGRLRLSRDAVVFVMIARLIRSKGVLEYGRAAKILRAFDPRSVCLLAGPAERGSDHLSGQELQRIGEHVRWLGPIDDVGEVLSASDVFVLPSYYREGMPRVLLEAAAAGLPVITTDVPGCRDAVADGTTGVLVRPRDVDSLISAMRHLAGDADLRAAMGTAGRDRAAALFSVEAVATQLRSIYRQLAADAGLTQRQE